MNNDYITVTELNKYIKNILEEDIFLKSIYLKGEISNFKAHSRGHYYFTLKDETSRINSVMFSYYTNSLKFVPQDGMKVMVTGKIGLYDATGNYQIYVDSMIEDGIGNLYVAFNQLKDKLDKEGLFDQSKKKKIPKVPKKIGIITAPTGAAIKDILTTIKRRFPICETVLFPSLVQGNGAKEDIVKKIKLANTIPDIDTLIVGRGGGSIEDLWAFNEEIVARAIYESSIPVISAVGHEIDFTISDFVADLRAPTPTAAAELAVPNIETIHTYLNNVNNRCNSFITNYLDMLDKRITNIKSNYILNNPLSMYEVKEQKLDILIDKITREMSIVLDNYNKRINNIKGSYVLNNPKILYELKIQNLNKLIEKINVLNPINTLNRGYAIVKSKDKVVTSAKVLKVNDEISIKLKDNTIKALVIE